MIKETKKAPIIRFREFTDDWEQRKFDEIASRESSTGMSSEILPSVEYEDVISEVGQLNKDIAEKAVHKKGIKFDKIHVLYGKLRPYLHNWINPRFKGIAVGDWWVLKPVATDKDFLYRLIQTKQFDDIANLSTGSKMPRADWNLVSKSEFMIPGELKEQHLIGQCFSNLDNLITLHQRKLDQLKTLKKYFLQNMFTAKGEKVPRIRFKGFTGDWEQRKIADVAEIITGGTPSTRIVEYWNPPEVPWLSSGEVHKKYITSTDTMISRKGYENSSATMVRENSVLIALAGQGKTRGTVAINRIPLSTNQSIAAMTFSDDIDPDYVFSNLENRYEELRSISSGDGSRGGLNKKLVGDVTIPCPTLLEQNAIGTLFRVLNELITLHQRKLDQLQTMKKFMLQNMFI